MEKYVCQGMWDIKESGFSLRDFSTCTQIQFQINTNDGYDSANDKQAPAQVSFIDIQ